MITAEIEREHYDLAIKEQLTDAEKERFIELDDMIEENLCPGGKTPSVLKTQKSMNEIMDLINQTKSLLQQAKDENSKNKN